MFFSGVRDIESRAASHAARWVLVLRGESFPREEQGAVAVHASHLSRVRSHVARPDLRVEQRALARAPDGARERARRRPPSALRCRSHRPSEDR